MTLNAAFARVGQNPRDPDALIDAGQAARTVGDVDAGIGFFHRVEQVTPGNPRIKPGLARALVRSGNPYDALPLFDEAERAGAIDQGTALDRGLAYDLVADSTTAQRYYRQALVGGANDEVTRRLAISLAIAGDKRVSGTTLSPLLMRQDKPRGAPAPSRSPSWGRAMKRSPWSMAPCPPALPPVSRPICATCRA